MTGRRGIDEDLTVLLAAADRKQHRGRRFTRLTAVPEPVVRR